MSDDTHRICELEKEIAVLKAQKADNDDATAAKQSAVHAFWAAILAVIMAIVEIAITLLRR